MYIFQMTGFEPWTSVMGSDRSTNCATTTAQVDQSLNFAIELLDNDFQK